MRVEPPYTVYFVAVVWIHSSEQKHMIASDSFIVSGRCPLLAGEAIARGRNSIVAKWDVAKCGPHSEWMEGAATLIGCQIEDE